MLKREVTKWMPLQHENVAVVRGLVYNKGIMPGIVLDFYANGNVIEYLTLDEVRRKDKRRMVRDFCSSYIYLRLQCVQVIGTASGLAYLHSHNIIHGDLRGVSSNSDMFMAHDLRSSR